MVHVALVVPERPVQALQRCHLHGQSRHLSAAKELPSSHGMQAKVCRPPRVHSPGESACHALAPAYRAHRALVVQASASHLGDALELLGADGQGQRHLQLAQGEVDGPGLGDGVRGAPHRNMPGRIVLRKVRQPVIDDLEVVQPARKGSGEHCVQQCTEAALSHPPPVDMPRPSASHALPAQHSVHWHTALGCTLQEKTESAAAPRQ